MSGFVLAKDGQRYSLDHVVEVLEQGLTVQVALVDREQWVAVDTDEWFDSVLASAPIVPATPGNFVLDVFKHDGTWKAHRYAVVVWRYWEQEIVPVTTEPNIDVDNRDGRYPVLFADGHVESRGRGTWESLAAYLAWRAAKEQPEPEQF